MSRYEKINYEELEMLAANGGMDDQGLPYTAATCNCTIGNVCKRIKKTIKISIEASKVSIQVTFRNRCIFEGPIEGPIEMQP